MALFKAVVWALIFLTKLRFPPGVCIAIVLKCHCKCHVQLSSLCSIVQHEKQIRHFQAPCPMYILFIISELPSFLEQHKISTSYYDL